MLGKVAGFEIRYQFRNPVFWVAFVIFFLFGFGLTGSENVRIGISSAAHKNAPFAIAVAMALMSLFYQFVITSFVANAIIRDDATGFAPIIRATPLGKSEFVLGRFLGGLGIALIGYLALPIGLALGSVMPWVDPETVGPNDAARYLWHFLIIAVPNVIFSSAMLLALATSFRSMMATYIGLLIFLVGYTITTVILSGAPENLPTVAKFELLGIAALREVSRYWTTAEINSLLVPLSGNVLINRLFILALSAVMLAVTVWRFSFAERAPSKRRLRKMAKVKAKEEMAAAQTPLMISGPVNPVHNASAVRAQLSVRFKTELLQVVKSPGMIVILLLAVFNTSAGLVTSRDYYGTTSYPLTADVIQTVRDSFSLFWMIIAIFYGGELVWRERDRKLNEIIDSTPVSGWVILVPKMVAILAALLLVNLTGMLTGIGTQLFGGSTDFSLVKYIDWLVIPSTIDAFLIAVLAVFMQVVSPSKYIGWGLMLVWFVVAIFLSNLGYDNLLYHYAATPGQPLSDMNGAGGFWVGAAWARAYWVSFAALLIVIAHLIWPRGTGVSLFPRLAGMRQRLGPGSAGIGAAAIAVMIGSGLYIHHNIKTLNTYRTPEEVEKLSADYERKYLKYENLKQPAVTSLTADAQLYPRERRLDVTGRYMLRNNSGTPLRDVHVRKGSFDVNFKQLTIAGARLISDDKPLGYRIYRFDTALAPGATAQLSYASQIWYRGFRNGAPATNLALNGSFVNNFDFAPIIGMDRNLLLDVPAKRRKQGLPSELRTAKLEDMSATQRNYVHSDWVTTDIRVTTDSDQIPVAPGDRVSESAENGRRTARFVTSAPIMHFYSIQSAAYAIAKAEHNGVAFEVYHHPAHNRNVASMIKALGTSLDYFRANFGPYQFNHARILEFPGYRSFAQAFAGTIPYSENIGFVADVRDPEDIDYVTYVTAHELAHQYWAHQVIGADMQGGTMTSETLAQYSALMVMRKTYGPDKIRRFLKYELDRYLSGRKGESVEEMPLYRVENQPYVHYRKGALAMYLLQERIGEAAVNRALARFLTTWRFKGPPYLRSTDLIDEFRKEARSPEEQTLITDLFEKITIYDLKAKTASVSKQPNGQWQIKLMVEARKFYADGKGVEKETPLKEAIEIGLFTARPGLGSFAAKDVVILSRRMLRSGQQEIIVQSATKPSFAGVDPYNFYIDRNSDDNLIAVGT